MQREIQTQERQREKHCGIQKREKAFLLRATGRLPEQARCSSTLKDIISTEGPRRSRKEQEARQKKA